MIRILDQYNDWSAISIGEERTNQNFPTHKKHFNLGKIPHNKLLDYERNFHAYYHYIKKLIILQKLGYK